MVHTTAERLEIIEFFFGNNQCANRTAELFNERHENSKVQRKYVLELVSKFQETGSVTNRKLNIENPVRNEGMEVAVLGHNNVDPTLSTNQLETVTGISRRSIQRTLKAHKFHPCKIHLVQELYEDDFDRRSQFSKIMSERIINDPNFLFNTCFSDESSFFLNGLVNRHTCRYWSDNNPRVYREVHTQYPQKLNVWAGIFGDNLVGPFFLPGNLTGEMYLELLPQAIDPALTAIIETQNDRYDEDRLMFQEDGAPPHYTLFVREYLDRTFPGRWIGRRGAIEWPPRSPDLSPLDFFLWGHLKSKVYETACGFFVRRFTRQNCK
ncbi:uncharacterized protein LOC126744391 isoform X2 [Anthonomus grandis grandis]|uniref:uncharacterized protein LOC126744391 isoform X1 n=1 Tax=Anthonomus grandis grandis TaxID=2921223 RepID=UPI0021658B92|nr:uncharacterized protein LOC126744391 isoform X1 [Anthonomus grandis grandis]XP_050307734.1 uncharacterized protein LOC126744391 isoform X2 [Anthonomus grandis grandis]